MDAGTATTASHAVDRLQQALQAALADSAAGARFTAEAGDLASPLLPALPPRFAAVWHDLINRLEASALFDEESCSFSRRELLEQMQLWLDKARERLAAG